MQTLRPRQWLNDEVINYFFKNCLAKRDEMLCEKEPGRRRSHFFNTFFVQTMFDEKNIDRKLKGKYNYNMVERWSRNVPGKNIFNLKYIFCPINHDNKHWTSAVIFMKDMRIQYYDSLAASDDSDGGYHNDFALCKRRSCKKCKIRGSIFCDVHKNQLCKRPGCFQFEVAGGVCCVAHSKLEGLLEYVKDEYRAKKGKELDVTKWELVSCPMDTPQQRNSEFVFLGARLPLFRILHSNIVFLKLAYDCGVFTCMVGDFISRDIRPLFNQDHMELCRDRIAFSIMTNCAMDDSANLDEHEPIK